ncbi:MAG: hypothetical protein CR979_00415 [Propionibacterium sp.]|nr:MAG: hypothetical protein CR979_00415 [Propionibacterium sp.]
MLNLRTEYSGGLQQFIRFGIVGGSGVFVNFAVLWLQRKLLPFIWPSAVDDEAILFKLGDTEYNIRWYMVFVAVSFLVANLWNFQLNRTWSFKAKNHANWWQEYWPFLAVGLICLGIGYLVVLALMHPHSVICLNREIFDSSTGLRTPIYWANLAMIMVTIPVSFLLNKYWTFRAIRRGEH